MNPYLLSFALTTLCLGALPQRPIAVGKPLPTISATAASGPWLERAPFDPATYGKVRGTSPATYPEANLVLYTPTLSEDFFRLALAVDAVVGKHPELKWAFVQVSDKKGAQRGGYTATELTARLREIQTLAEKHGISHLSFLVSAPPARPGDTTITLAHTKPGTLESAHAVVDWTAQADAATLTPETIQKLIKELSATMRS